LESTLVRKKCHAAEQTFASFSGLLFWTVATRTVPSKDIGLAIAAASMAALILELFRLDMWYLLKICKVVYLA
jgi:hypothetical protein